VLKIIVVVGVKPKEKEKEQERSNIGQGGKKGEIKGGVLGICI